MESMGSERRSLSPQLVHLRVLAFARLAQAGDLAVLHPDLLLEFQRLGLQARCGQFLRILLRVLRKDDLPTHHSSALVL